MVLLRSHPLFRTDLKWIAWSVSSFNLTIVQELKQVRFYLKTKESCSTVPDGLQMIICTARASKAKRQIFTKRYVLYT